MHNSSFSLDGRRALITGSSRGIGAAIARLFAAQGARVVVHGTGSGPVGREVALSCGSNGVPAPLIGADLGTVDGPERLFREAEAALGGLDILVLNASYQKKQPWLELTDEELAPYFAVNYRASLRLTQLAVPGMQARRWGRILMVGSVQEIKPHPQMLAYSSFKHAQTGLVESLSITLAPHGITVNNLAPGVIVTDRNSKALGDKEYAQGIMNRLPVGRFGEPEDCASAALFFCSDAASYVTGQTLFVDGGYGRA
jgi:NAD(P)-dependent dehydrogenase (short-subunit alcohol dehydrogenase family)